MKAMKFITCLLAACVLVFSSCDLSNTAKGAMIGTAGGAAGGAALGAAIGALAGNAGLGAAIGAGAGTLAGATAGTLIGRKMDKAKKAAEAALAEQATVETTTDANGLEAVKVTIEGGILFASGKAALTSKATENLNKFANSVLKAYTDCDVAIQGYTDTDKWKGKTAEQSVQANLTLSQQRADAVKNYFIACGVNAAQIASSVGFGQTNIITNASGVEDKQASRRVEIYLYASKEMIEKANAGTLQ